MSKEFIANRLCTFSANRQNIFVAFVHTSFQNLASALTSLAFVCGNIFPQQVQDADENLAIDNDLLCAIEAESWVNGTRGILVESRAPPLPRLDQNCSLFPVAVDERHSRYRYVDPRVVTIVGPFARKSHTHTLADVDSDRFR